MKDSHPLARKKFQFSKVRTEIRSLFVSDKFDFTINRKKLKISITPNVIGISTRERVRIGHRPILTLSNVEIPISDGRNSDFRFVPINRKVELVRNE